MRYRNLLCLLFFLQAQAFAQKSLDAESIRWFPFQWDGDSIRPRDAIMVNSTIDTLKFNFRWQFDTGSPVSFFYGNAWNSFMDAYPFLRKKYVVTDSSLADGFVKMKEPKIKFGKTPLPKNFFSVLNDYGDVIPTDVILANEGSNAGIGTLGLDQFRNAVLIMDFKTERIGYCEMLSDKFYASKYNTLDFIFYKNRIVLPVFMGGKKYYFFYDSGASLFPVKTTKYFSASLPAIPITDTLYNITTWGKSYDVPGGMSPMALKIGSMELGKQMIYIHPDPENYHTDIFKEANTLGLLGNKLFENKICLIDFTRMKFTILN